jgi:hypothetical protein
MNNFSKFFFQLILILCFVLINSVTGKGQDSCRYKEFNYLNYKDWDNIRVIYDSMSFNNYILFKVSLNEENGNSINVEIFFENNLKNLFVSKRLYTYVVYNWPLYTDTWGHKGIDSITYLKIINQGKEKFPEKKGLYFDRLDVLINTASIFKNLTPWSVSKKSKDVYYIFKTNFDGILIENNLKRTSKEKSYKKNIKVLIPFIRYLPLYEVPVSELTSANLIARKPLKICLED